ncbi:MAG: tRNA (N(6)-L-threonylcarbamoyladenosine(37)-C(2))-methylthiotransferase MtaB [Myxococcales bacterium FL481]|nr:MAG: tRNA (N(6)-L-threonylcarbamoyladenosine(37)-C(2))-methylthiotransferase MtaB [Myxococcales bacterium FL481]
MRVALDTHGCRLNQFESEAIARALDRAGHRLVEGPSAADVYVLNTCTVTGSADADARKAIRRARRTNPGLAVVVTGCYATRAADEIAALDGVEMVLGNVDKDGLVGQLEAVFGRSGPAARPPAAGARSGPVVSVEALTRFAHLPPALDATARTRAYLKVQDGCDYRCSFCIVPRVRGPSRSLTVTQAVGQLRALVAAGRPEVVLTGVHLGTYGRDLADASHRVRFSDLVEALLPHLGRARLRLSSLDPHEVDNRLLDLLRHNSARLCPHLHLPMQSGDDEVLRRMRRAHTVADLAELAPRAVAAVEGLAIGSDIIVGFPGETEESFARTCALLEALPLAYLHVFTYSDRDGTHATTLPDPVPIAERRRRNAVLRELSQRKWTAFRHMCMGQIRSAVVERATADGRLEAVTDNYVRVWFDGPTTLIGQRVNVELTGVEAQGAVGRFASSTGAAPRP